MSLYSEAVLFFNDVSEFQNSGIYTFCTELFAQFVIYVTVAIIEFKIYAITFAWDVAKEVITQLNLSNSLTSAWSLIDSKTLQILSFFNIPDAINIIVSAKITKFVLRFLGI